MLVAIVFVLMSRHPPISTLTDTLSPYTSLFLAPVEPDPCPRLGSADAVGPQLRTSERHRLPRTQPQALRRCRRPVHRERRQHQAAFREGNEDRKSVV